MTPRAVCFDLDDTLYDYRAYAEAGLRAAADELAAQTGEQLHEELVALYFEDGVTDGTFDRLLAEHDLSQSLSGPLVDAYHESTAPLSPFPETEPVLSLLADSSRLGLITDGRGGHAKLDHLGIRAYFDAVLVTPTIDSSKRDPAVFDRVLSELSVSPADAVYVGDDPRVDFRVPNELGMTTVRVRGGRYESLEPSGEAARPDHEITHLGGLLLVL